MGWITALSLCPFLLPNEMELVGSYGVATPVEAVS